MAAAGQGTKGVQAQLHICAGVFYWRCMGSEVQGTRGACLQVVRVQEVHTNVHVSRCSRYRRCKSPLISEGCVQCAWYKSKACKRCKECSRCRDSYRI